ncbi:MAG TPA: ribosome small subunit-dependent GTPase A [Oscillospiraceae bacterium]|nr:ribosome small subunit-dependent GTPase A [Oscillospiraceae bacterium]
MDGIIIKGIGGFYYVEAADGIIYECKARGVFRKEKITPLAGDKVEISVDENNKNSIDKIYERRNMFKRPPIANVDKLVIVSSVCDPRPNLLIIDRLSAVAVYKNVEPIIVFTKNDLQSADEYIEIYKNAGFKTFAVSNETGEGIGEIKAVIENGVCVFTGNSGVGKSSLINRMYPDFALETGEISKKLGRGRHTTRHVELLKINNGYIADTPGFSSLDFETNDLIKKDELAFCFPDFSDYIDSCKFSTCAHVNDKGCRLIEAVNNGDVMRSRHESYVTMYNEVKDIKDWQL